MIIGTIWLFLCKFRVLFVRVLIIISPLFGVYIRAPDFGVWG